MSTAAFRICFVGDSLTLGVGDPAGIGWVGRVCASLRGRGLDFTAYNLGIRRDTSADIRARWRDETARRLPETVPGRVVFAFGTNDCLDENGARRVPHAGTIENARAVLTEAGRRFDVFLIGPPPTAHAAENERLHQLGLDLDRLCAGLGVPYLDTFGPLHATDGWLPALTDGYHPGADGYAALAEIAGPWLIQSGALDPSGVRPGGASRA